MNYWADYERILTALTPVKKVLRAVGNFDPHKRSPFTHKEAMRLIELFMEARGKFYSFADTGNYMAQLLLLTDVHWSKKLHSSHLCLEMEPTILGAAPTQDGSVLLRMPVLYRYKMLSDNIFESKREELYKCVPVLHKNNEVFAGASWGNTPHGWIYPGSASRDILKELAVRWKNMANLINEKEMDSIILPHDAMWLLKRCFQEHKVRIKLAKCERLLVKKLAEMMFGEDYRKEAGPLIAPQSARLQDGSLLTLGLPSMFNSSRIVAMSDMQLSMFSKLKISAAMPSVSWRLKLDGPHPVSREKLLVDREV